MKQSTPIAGSICHNARQATSYFQIASDRPGTEVTNPQKQEAGITCPAGMDSKESEHPRAMGRSSGVRLSVDERLLARASSCTNMIPGETRGRQAGRWDSGAGRAAIQQMGLGPWDSGMAGGLSDPPTPATWITE